VLVIQACRSDDTTRGCINYGLHSRFCLPLADRRKLLGPEEVQRAETFRVALATGVSVARVFLMHARKIPRRDSPPSSTRSRRMPLALVHLVALAWTRASASPDLDAGTSGIDEDKGHSGANKSNLWKPRTT